MGDDHLNPVDQFEDTLYYHSVESQLLEAGREDLPPSARHGDRIAQLCRIQRLLTQQGWHVRFFKYAFLSKHGDWIIYATRGQDDRDNNEDIDESLARWELTRRARGFQFRSFT